MRPSGETSPKRGLLSRVRAVVVDRNHAELTGIKHALLSTDLAEIAAETTSYSLAPPLVERHDPDFVFISIGDDIASGGELISNVRSKCGTSRIVAVGSRADSDDILRCFRSGADEFLVKPLHEEQLLLVFERLHERRSLPADEKEVRGQIIAFWGSRGGCGTTTVACNTACELALWKPTVLVDLHFDQGDLAVHLDVQPSFSLRDASESPEQIDETLIESITVKHPSGVRLLLQPFDEKPPQLTEETISRVLQVLSKQYAYVILDIGHDDSVGAAIADYTNAFYLVTAQELPSLYLAARKLRLLDTCGYGKDRVFVVVNEFVKRGPVTLDRVTKALGKPQLACVRKDEASVQSATNQGIPLRQASRRGKATKDIAQLAQMIRDREPAAEATQEKKKLTSSPEPQKNIWQERVRLSTAGN